jgi:FkbM family methyltransferase
MVCSAGVAIEDQGRWYLRHFDVRGEVVADVGANVGALSQFFWDHGDEHTRVISIEPLPENLAELSARARTAGDPRWRVEACAVSDRTGTVWMQVIAAGGAHDGAHDGPHDGVVREGPGPGLRELPCRTLPELAPDATIVKLDVEGYEHAILDHALSRMPGVHAWAVELHQSSSMSTFRPLEQTIAAFEAAGFAVHAAVRHKDDPSRWQSARVRPSLGWHRIPPAISRPDGSVFKMLHIVACRVRS